MKSSKKSATQRNAGPPPAQLPISALLSFALAAFTIEFDNEFEHRMPHRITNSNPEVAGVCRGPWLTSLVMYCNCMRFVDEQGIRASELEKLARTPTNLNGMERWGYITVAPDPNDPTPKPPRSDRLIRATAAGLGAREIWRPLFPEIENRWRERFGPNVFEALEHSLRKLAGDFDEQLPDCLPILQYGLLCKSSDRSSITARANLDRSEGKFSLAALLSRLLLAFALEFESESEISLAVGANILRVLRDEKQPLRDLPAIAGVSIESISMALGILRKRRFIRELPAEKGGRGKLICLTPIGKTAQVASQKLISTIEERWRKRNGINLLSNLRAALERVTGNGSAPSSPLFRGLTPYPDGWRATAPPMSTLPHFPMVLHRGGYPDGS